MKTFIAAAVVLFTSATLAADYSATTTANAAIRVAPSQEAPAKGTIPAGTPLSVEVCFNEGAYCLVSGPDLPSAFVAGELMVIDGQGVTVLDAEREKWKRIREANLNPKVPDWEAKNIVVWGDSLSSNTFGDELERLLLGRRVAMQGVPGEDGAKIAARMLAHTSFDKRIKVIWDRHWSGQNPDQYMADIAPMVEKAQATGSPFIVVSDVPDLDGTETVSAEDDLAQVEAINAALQAAYPDNYLDMVTPLADPSLRTDGLHLAPRGESAVARAIADFITQKSW